MIRDFLHVIWPISPHGMAKNALMLLRRVYLELGRDTDFRAALELISLRSCERSYYIQYAYIVQGPEVTMA